MYHGDERAIYALLDRPAQRVLVCIMYGKNLSKWWLICILFKYFLRSELIGGIFLDT